MASGRRDYTWGFLNEAAVEGRYTESFVKHGVSLVDAWEGKILYEYTVPAGYRLCINRIEYSTNSRVVNVAQVLWGSSVICFNFFSDNYASVFSDQNPFYLAAGETLSAQCVNNDEKAYAFYCSIIGSLQSLI